MNTQALTVAQDALVSTQLDAPVAPEPQAAGNPLDLPTSIFSGALERRGNNRKSLMNWIREALVNGTDFGTIQIGGRESKPSLRKSGAEKICGMLGLRPIFPTLPLYEAAAIEGKDINNIILRCHLLDPQDRIVADGVGARSVDKDKGDINKALKMAEKSAMIDAVLRCAGLSEIFTQDIEDMNFKTEEAGWDNQTQRKHYVVELGRCWGAKDNMGLRQLWDELTTEQKEDVWGEFNSVQRREMKEMLASTKEQTNE